MGTLSQRTRHNESLGVSSYLGYGLAAAGLIEDFLGAQVDQWFPVLPLQRPLSDLYGINPLSHLIVEAGSRIAEAKPGDCRRARTQ
ncbi:unnamed protein product [Calypogeia fissa]